MREVRVSLHVMGLVRGETQEIHHLSTSTWIKESRPSDLAGSLDNLCTHKQYLHPSVLRTLGRVWSPDCSGGRADNGQCLASTLQLFLSQICPATFLLVWRNPCTDPKRIVMSNGPQDAGRLVGGALRHGRVQRRGLTMSSLPSPTQQSSSQSQLHEFTKLITVLIQYLASPNCIHPSVLSQLPQHVPVVQANGRHPKPRR